MKNLSMQAICACVFIACLITRQTPVQAQCTPATIKTIAYDTTVTGSGNSISGFTFPRFNPALGTLMSVKLQSVVSVGYSFSLENRELIPKSYTLKIGRDDVIQSDALTEDFQNSTLKTFGPYSLASWDGVSGTGTDYTSRQVSVLHNYVITDSITDAVALFMGAGQVSFQNLPSTYSIIQGGASYSLLGAASDTTHFSITYQYCDASMLPSGITVFSAMRDNNQSVQLRWQTVNEESGRYYEVEKSTDGTHFTRIGAQPSRADGYQQGSYTWKYAVQESDPGKLYFRIRRSNGGSDIFYSDTRTVHLLGAGGKSLYLYPNPSAQFINVQFNQPGKNWQVDILSADGRLLLRKVFANSNSAHIDFSGLLKPGAYFMRATERQSGDNHVAAFTIR